MKRRTEEKSNPKPRAKERAETVDPNPNKRKPQGKRKTNSRTIIISSTRIIR